MVIAPAVLASHRSVEPNGTVTVAITARFKDGAKPGGKAEILRQMKLSMLQNAHAAEPLFWAPFSLIGGGGELFLGQCRFAVLDHNAWKCIGGCSC